MGSLNSQWQTPRAGSTPRRCRWQMTLLRRTAVCLLTAVLAPRGPNGPGAITVRRVCLVYAMQTAHNECVWGSAMKHESLGLEPQCQRCGIVLLAKCGGPTRPMAWRALPYRSPARAHTRMGCVPKPIVGGRVPGTGQLQRRRTSPCTRHPCRSLHAHPPVHP